MRRLGLQTSSIVSLSISSGLSTTLKFVWLAHRITKLRSHEGNVWKTSGILAAKRTRMSTPRTMCMNINIEQVGSAMWHERLLLTASGQASLPRAHRYFSIHVPLFAAPLCVAGGLLHSQISAFIMRRERMMSFKR